MDFGELGFSLGLPLSQFQIERLAEQPKCSAE